MLIKPISFWQPSVPSFNPPLPIQNIYVCGYDFYKWKGTRLGSTTGGGVAKIDMTGSLDTTWTTNANPSPTTQVRFLTALNNNVYCDVRSTDTNTRVFRKINSSGTVAASVSTSSGVIWGLSAREGNSFFLITGEYTISFNGVSIRGIGKINESLSADTTFNTNLGTGPSGGSLIYGSHASADRIAVCGAFTSWNGNSSYDRFLILNYNGTRDTDFVRSGGFNTGAIVISALFIANKWIVIGTFTTYNGITRNKIMAFNTNGSVDTTFSTNIGTGFNGDVSSILKVSDTQFVVGGAFTTLNGVTQNRIALLNTDGTIPTQPFGTGTSHAPSYIAIANTGKYYISGAPPITTYNGFSSNNFFAINSDGSIDSNFITGSAMQVNGTAAAEAGGVYVF